MAEIKNIKLNGLPKLILLVIVVAGILIGVGKILQKDSYDSIRLSSLENLEIGTRLTTLEINYVNIEKALNRIEKKIDKWQNSNLMQR